MKIPRVKGKFLIKQKETKSKSQNIIFISRVRLFNLNPVHIFFSTIGKKKPPLLSSFKIYVYYFFKLKEKFSADIKNNSNNTKYLKIKIEIYLCKTLLHRYQLYYYVLSFQRNLILPQIIYLSFCFAFIFLISVCVLRTGAYFIHHSIFSAQNRILVAQSWSSVNSSEKKME